MIIYWKDRKSPLTALEVDGNFQHIMEKLAEVEERLRNLESQMVHSSANQPSTEKIIFSCKDNIITLTEANGKFQEVVLPLWQFKGNWNQDQLYYPGNLVIFEKKIHRCCESTQGPQFISSYWERLPFCIIEEN
ncbi:hypothetical protein [Holospora undulata]|uniref:Uncharacterized protein n=3 Tax=Holospora TaxID=44747 RepID=A0A061JIF3_9PROT|nr:hypothetical protein [Holospora undulata]ETZ04814.1 hypothetical protein K737_300769 [Holospora undulata HU1]GAJ46172.1 hypothetical protein HE1_00497 [Holospora elegans E1]